VLIWPAGSTSEELYSNVGRQAAIQPIPRRSTYGPVREAGLGVEAARLLAPARHWAKISHGFRKLNAQAMYAALCEQELGDEAARLEVARHLGHNRVRMMVQSYVAAQYQGD